MSEPNKSRELVVSLTGLSVEEKGDAHLLVYRLGSQIEIVVIEENGADASVLLFEEQARAIASALRANLDK
jgi:hypothetical protein